MNSNKKKIFILLFIVVFSFLIRFTTLNQIGRTWDEQEYIEQGYQLTELYKKADINNKLFYSTYDHPPLVKYLYGLTAHFDVSKSNGYKQIFNYDYTYSRILSILFFLISSIFVILISWKIFNPKIGIISGIIYTLLPFTVGLSQLVTAESLKLLTYTITIYSYLFLFEKLNKKSILISGILTGVALQAKQSNVLLFLILGFTIYFYFKENINVKFKIKYYLRAFFIILATSWVVFFLIWPQALLHLNEIMQINDKLWSVKFSSNLLIFTLSPPEVFMGSLRITPIFYYVIYFFITIPAVVISIFLYGFIKLLKDVSYKKWLIILWFIVPFLLSFYSWRQHGLRYIVEIYPAISIISAFGLYMLLTQMKKIQQIIILFFFVLYLLINLLSVKPYYLDYFNELVGGVNTVYKYNLFQIGWWGQGQRAAGLYLQKNAKNNSTIGLAVSPETTFPKNNKFKYSEYNKKLKYDYVVVNHYHIIRDGFNDKEIKQNYDLVYEVKVSKAVLVYVYKAK